MFHIILDVQILVQDMKMLDCLVQNGLGSQSGTRSKLTPSEQLPGGLVVEK